MHSLTAAEARGSQQAAGGPRLLKGSREQPSCLPASHAQVALAGGRIPPSPPRSSHRLLYYLSLQSAPSLL